MSAGTWKIIYKAYILFLLASTGIREETFQETPSRVGIFFPRDHSKPLLMCHWLWLGCVYHHCRGKVWDKQIG